MKAIKATTFAAAIMTLVFPIAALADLTGTATLSSGTALNLNTGSTGSSGDILWTGSSITFQGSAKGLNYGNVGASFYGTLTQSVVQAAAAAATNAPIPLSSLVVGNVFIVQTASGSVSKELVTAQSGSSITIQYTTFGVSGGTSGPTIAGVSNNYSFIASGFSNSGIAPSSIFDIFGSGLATAPSGAVTLNSSLAPGLPKTSNGASIAVTVGTTTVSPAIYFATPTQIAAVMPANTPTGNGTITVTFNGVVSNSFPIQIVPSALGLDTYYGTGSGLVVATNNNTGALFNYTNSAAPGQTIVLWGSGSGADTADSDTVFTSSPHAVNQSSTQIYFGGVLGTTLYAGSSGYPGLVQINVTIPSTVPTGCGVSVAGVVGGVTSNFGVLPINPGGGPCTDALYGTTGTRITSLSSQTTVKSGSVAVGMLTTASGGTINTASASFSSNTGASFGASNVVSAGSCVASEAVGTGTSATSTPLDAGTLSLKGPLATYALPAFSTGIYQTQLPSGAIPSTGGAFVFTGSGGANVGSFTATVNLPNPLLSWTNVSASATVTRSQGQLITWSGGAPGSYLQITGSSSNTASGLSGSYICYAPQSAGQFTVPAYVLNALPAGSGSTSVDNITGFSTFSASGLDNGTTFGFTGTSANSNFL